MYNALTELSCREAVDFILNYHGMQLLSKGFFEQFVGEGLLLRK